MLSYKVVKDVADQKEKEEKEEKKERPGGGAGAGGSSQEHELMESMSASQLRATQESLPVFLDATWHVGVVDIERTLMSVTHKVCNDFGVPEEERKLRAQALGVMGEAFMAVASAQGGSKDAKAQVPVA